MTQRIALVLLILCWPFASGAEGFTSMTERDARSALDGSAILDTGNISVYQRRSGVNSIFKIGSRCFSSHFNFNVVLPESKAAFLFMSNVGQIQVALFEVDSGSSIKVTIAQATLVDCIAVSRQQSDDIRREGERVLRQLEIEQQQLKRIEEQLKRKP